MTLVTRLCFLTALFCLLVSCGEKKNIPSTEIEMVSDSLISPEKMVLILGDVHVVEAAMLLDQSPGKDIKANGDFYYQGVFGKYHISRQRYDANLKYYRQNPAKMSKMYDKVIRDIETKEKNFPPGR
ncbi:MAG: DUF4296 domain-containing protein [Bacteroidota bacterium]